MRGPYRHPFAASRLSRSLQLPGDGHTFGGRLAGNHELDRGVGTSLAVDPQTVLGRQHPATASELPDPAATDTQKRALPVRSGGGFHRRSEVEADRKRDIL